MRSAAHEEAWTYDSLQPGHDFGQTRFSIDAGRVAGWAQIYGGAEGDRVPPGLLVVEMMRAYLDLVQPRPPGNIHAGQRLHCLDLDVPADAAITASVRCLEKTRRKGRGWVTFDVVLRSQERDVLQGEIVTIWAT